jgi:hypothetical protein
VGLPNNALKLTSAPVRGDPAVKRTLQLNAVFDGRSSSIVERI